MSALQRQLVHKKMACLNDTPSNAQGNGKTRKTKATRKVARVEARPPPLPPTYKGHLQFYGFYVNEDWVMKFAQRQRPGNEPRNIGPALFWFMRYLRDKAQYSNIKFGGAIIEADTPPEATVGEGCTGILQIPIIVLCSWKKAASDYRPTQAQVKILSEIMEMEPRWFIDVNPPNMYYE